MISFKDIKDSSNTKTYKNKDQMCEKIIYENLNLFKNNKKVLDSGSIDFWNQFLTTVAYRINNKKYLLNKY